jgi:hypothetical protein
MFDDAAEARVSRLERRLRRFQAAGALLVLGGGVLFLAAARPASKARIVEATEVHLLDTNGAVRGVMSADRTGTQLVFKDGGGKTRARIRVADDGTPRFELLDRAERVRLGMELGRDGAPAARLDDEQGHSHATLSAAADGTSRLELGNGAKKRAALEVGADQSAGLAIYDADENARLRSVVAADGGPAVKLIGADGTLRASLGNVSLKEAGTGANERTQEGSLVLYDRKGAVVFKQPK